MSVEIENLITRLDTVCKGMEEGLDDWPLASHIWEYRKSIEVIESLRQQLADLKNIHNQTVSNGVAGFKAIRQQLAECQAREAKRLEELDSADNFSAGYELLTAVECAKAVPSDATALNELITERTASLTAEVERLRAITHVSIPTDTMEQWVASEIRIATNRLRQQNSELTTKLEAEKRTNALQLNTNDRLHEVNRRESKRVKILADALNNIWNLCDGNASKWAEEALTEVKEKHEPS